MNAVSQRLKHALIATFCLLAALFPAQAALAGESSITLRVPKRPNPATQLEISAVKITLLLDSTAPIGLTVKNTTVPAINDRLLVTENMDLTSIGNDCFGAACFGLFPNSDGPLEDALLISKPLQAGADPASSVGPTPEPKLVLFLQLDSNISPTCTSTMDGDETFTISVNGGGARIVGVAVQTLDKATTSPPACGTAYRATPLNSAPLAQIVGPATVLSGRVGVDAVMVLDRSGSMSSRANPADPASQPKMQQLHKAAGMFIDMWKQLRDNEAAAQIQTTTDRLGVVYFDDQIQWLKALVPGSQIDGPKNFASLNLANEKANIASVTANGWTSIGGGVKLAAEALPSPANETNRKVMVLMSDGMHNTAPDPSVIGNQVKIDSANLANQPPLKIYSVTVGTGVAVDPVLNQQLATATGGYYLNTEVDDSLLNNFFLQVLQNTHKFSTVETYRVLSDSARFSAPFVAQVPVTTTTTSLAFGLDWNPQRGRLRVRLTPPGGGTPLVFDTSGAVGTVTAPNTGTLTGGVRLPLQNGVGAGVWGVSIESRNDDDRPVPFNFILLGDDAAVNTSLGVVAAEHAVGGKIRLTAQANDFGVTLKQLGTKPGTRLQAFVVRPGQSVGDALAEAAVAPGAPAASDPASPAYRKLMAMLAKDPKALVRVSQTVDLRDDGAPASGDTTAGDGVYSALVPADVEGHYNIVFLVEGEAKSGGRFVRQQIRTVHVRSLPETKNTEYAYTIVDNAIRVTLTPRNARGGKLGPGWANYLWLVPAGNGTPVKPVDKLDGTYVATLPFSGGTPPKITLHFIDDPIFLPDSYIPPAGTLGNETEVVPDVTKPKGTDPGNGGLLEKLKQWLDSLPFPWWWLLIALIVLLLLWLLLRRKK